MSAAVLKSVDAARPTIGSGEKMENTTDKLMAPSPSEAARVVALTIMGWEFGDPDLLGGKLYYISRREGSAAPDYVCLANEWKPWEDEADAAIVAVQLGVQRIAMEIELGTQEIENFGVTDFGYHATIRASGVSCTGSHPNLLSAVVRAAYLYGKLTLEDPKSLTRLREKASKAPVLKLSPKGMSSLSDIKDMRA